MVQGPRRQRPVRDAGLLAGREGALQLVHVHLEVVDERKPRHLDRRWIELSVFLRRAVRRRDDVAVTLRSSRVRAWSVSAIRRSSAGSI